MTNDFTATLTNNKIFKDDGVEIEGILSRLKLINQMGLNYHEREKAYLIKCK